jgi:hypothetical protein
MAAVADALLLLSVAALVGGLPQVFSVAVVLPLTVAAVSEALLPLSAAVVAEVPLQLSAAVVAEVPLQLSVVAFAEGLLPVFVAAVMEALLRVSTADLVVNGLLTFVTAVVKTPLPSHRLRIEKGESMICSNSLPWYKLIPVYLSLLPTVPIFTSLRTLAVPVPPYVAFSSL